MKKLVCLFIAVLMCCSMVLPVMAEENGIFIPSMDAVLTSITVDGEDVSSLFGVFAMPGIKDGSADVSEDDGQLFMDAYDALSNGEKEIPMDGDFAFADMMLLDLNESNPEAAALLEKLANGAKLTVTLKPGLEELEGTRAFTLVDDQWQLVENYTINPDNTVTCVLSAPGPIVIVTPEGTADEEEEEQGAEGFTNGSTSGFVPSITYKDGPDLLSVISNALGEGDGESIIKCLVTTSVQEAKLGTTDISQEERDLLISVYEGLTEGSMKLPLEKEHVIRDLIDLNFFFNACRENVDHQKKVENLKEDGVTMTVDFRMNVAKDETVLVYCYVNKEWVPAEEVINNGDGTLTCKLEDVGPLAFVVSGEAPSETPWTGDVVGSNMGLWIGLMAVCAAGIVALIIIRKKMK